MAVKTKRRAPARRRNAGAYRERRSVWIIETTGPDFRWRYYEDVYEQLGDAKKRGQAIADRLGVDVRVQRRDGATSRVLRPKRARRRNPPPFGYRYNERTGYYDVVQGGKPIGLRFADQRKRDAFIRRANERAAMLERSAAWTKRPPSHVQARLFNPRRRRKPARSR